MELAENQSGEMKLAEMELQKRTCAGYGPWQLHPTGSCSNSALGSWWAATKSNWARTFHRCPPCPCARDTCRKFSNNLGCPWHSQSRPCVTCGCHRCMLSSLWIGPPRDRPIVPKFLYSEIPLLRTSPSLSNLARQKRLICTVWTFLPGQRVSSFDKEKTIQLFDAFQSSFMPTRFWPFNFKLTGPALRRDPSRREYSSLTISDLSFHRLVYLPVLV